MLSKYFSIAVSSDSSQNSDRELPLNNTSNVNQHLQVSSPIFASSPTQFHHLNHSNHFYATNGPSNRLSNIQSNSASLHVSANSTNETNTSTITNISIPTHSSTTPYQPTIIISKPNKPFNTQTGQFFQRDLDINLNCLPKPSSLINANNNNTNGIINRTSTMSISSNVSQYVSNMFNNLNSGNSVALNKNLISSPLNTSTLVLKILIL